MIDSISSLTGFPAAAAAYAAYAGRGYSGYPGFGLPGSIAGYPTGKTRLQLTIEIPKKCFTTVTVPTSVNYGHFILLCLFVTFSNQPPNKTTSDILPHVLGYIILFDIAEI